MTYKKAMKKRRGMRKSPKDIIKDKTDKYKQRMQGGPKGPPVSGNLRKV